MEQGQQSDVFVLVNETNEEKELLLLHPSEESSAGAGAPGTASGTAGVAVPLPTSGLRGILSASSATERRKPSAAGARPQQKLTIPAGGGLKITRSVLDLYDYRSLADSRQISVVPAAEPELVSPYRIIVNKTARHVRFRSIPQSAASELVITPFGKRRVSLSALRQLDLDPWRKLNLIKVVEPRPSKKSGFEWWIVPLAALFYGWIVILFLPQPLDLEALGMGEISRWWLWPFATVALGAGSFLFGSRKGASVRSLTVQAVNLMVLLVLGPVGLPILVALFFGGVFDQLQVLSLETLTTGLLDRGIQTTFIVLLSALPGLLYFQFERRQVNSIRTRFIRDIMMVNPSIQTVDDAEVTYGKMVDEVSGAIGATSNQFAVFSSARPILLSTLLITIGWIAALWPVGPLASIQSVHDLLIPHQTPVVFAFLGAYFFAINLIFRRYARGDLTPKAYSHVIVRIVSAVVVVWVVSVGLSATETFDGVFLLLMAFGIGIVPETGVALLKDLVGKSPLGRRFASVSVKHPITELEGISLYDQARLLEEGVESVENLAHNNLVELMLRSGIPTARLVDLVDQGILYLHVAAMVERGDGSAQERDLRSGMRILREAGIRTATDLLRVVMLADERVNAAAAKSPVNRRVLQELEKERDRIFQLLNEDSTEGPNRMRLVLDALSDDEWLEYVKNWRSLCRSGEMISDPEDFYRRGDGRA